MRTLRLTASGDSKGRGRLRLLVSYGAAALIVACALLLPQASRAVTLDGPVVTYSIDGIGGTNGWYRGSTGGNFVVVHWVVTGPVESTTGCEPAIQIPGPNTGITKTCTAIAPAGGGSTTVTTKLIKIDAAPPSVQPVPQRAPDSNGWYNHAVSASFAGTDATSGVASCTSGAYSGPDGAGTISGTCTDNAGNVGGGTYTLSYDATPPQLKKVTFKHANRAVTLRWQVSPDTQSVQITRAPGTRKATSLMLYTGKGQEYLDKRLHVGTKYRYTLTAFDAAANKVSTTVKVTATGALLSPAPGEAVKSAPRLSWTPVKGASYYNVLLVRGGTIFSAWPSKTSLNLPRRWTYHGHVYRFHPGVYRWFVWPGFGRLKANRYGGLLGRSSFLFAR